MHDEILKNGFRYSCVSAGQCVDSCLLRLTVEPF